MRGVWVGHWLHCPPESQFVGDRRVILKKLCFGPGEVQSWFAAEDGSVWYEHQFLEGIQEGERFLEPVSREELRRLLDHNRGERPYEEWLTAFCQRKYQSDFSREMTRSVAEYLTQYKGVEEK